MLETEDRSVGGQRSGSLAWENSVEMAGCGAGRNDPEPPQAHVQAVVPLGAFANEERRLGSRVTFMESEDGGTKDDLQNFL